MAAPIMTDDEILEHLEEFTRLHAVNPTTHTDIMCLVLRTEAKLRGLTK